jgi:hypothetical protein
MSVKPYYTVLERWDNVWHPQFGSFDRADCVDEVQCFRDAGTKKKDLMIIQTQPSQEIINEAVTVLNKGLR